VYLSLTAADTTVALLVPLLLMLPLLQLMLPVLLLMQCCAALLQCYAYRLLYACKLNIISVVSIYITPQLCAYDSDYHKL
jgi:hypothetical protein